MRADEELDSAGDLEGKVRKLKNPEATLWLVTLPSRARSERTLAV